MVNLPTLSREPDHAYLPPGYSDPHNVKAFVPEDDRAYYPHDEPDTDKQLTRDLIRDDRQMSRTVKDRGRVHTAQVSADTDFETAMHWRKCEIAATRRRSAEALAQQADADARWWTCAACGVVRSPSMADNAGVATRPLPGGLGNVHLCGRCFAIAERAVVDAVRDERVNGTTRAELVAAVLAEPLANLGT